MTVVILIFHYNKYCIIIFKGGFMNKVILKKKNINGFENE